MAEVTIYALLDADNRVRYVGKANDATRRLQTHISDSRRRRTPVCDWIKSRIAAGITPAFKVLEVCDSDTWREREKYWITHFRSISPLLNLADGGDEPKCSRETRAANGRKVVSLRVSTPVKRRLYELRKNLAIDLAGGYYSPELRDKIIARAKEDPAMWASFLRFL